LKLVKSVYIYVFLISAWFLLWLLKGDGFWWLTVLNRIVPYLFLPVLLFLFWLVRFREYKFTALLILPVSIFAFLYHPYIFPKPSKPAISDDALTVMTYNVLYSNLDYDAVANVILTHRPDLVALQEVLPAMMSALQDRLADEYPYSIHGTNHDYGVTAIFSRDPLADEQILDLGEDRRAVIVRTQINKQWVAFASVHLRAYGLQWVRPLTNIPQEIVRTTKAQNHQVELLWEELQDESGPVIIGCDCNTKETSSSYRMLDRWFDTAAYRVGWQFPGMEHAGNRQDTNMQHIDFIWYRGNLGPVAAYVIMDSGGSDHRPVLAVFDLP
jgi:endonuclease/exonuclease/phosphatase (EEP) superfamily protein YafD